MGLEGKGKGMCSVVSVYGEGRGKYECLWVDG